MCPLADTSFFVAFVDSNDDDHERAKEIFADIMHGNIERPLVNDYVLDETVTTVRRRTSRHSDAVKMGKLILNSKYVHFFRVLDEDVRDAFKEYKRHTDKDLSFTDWVEVCYMRRKGMKMIIAFDKHFDQVGLERIC